MYRAGDRVLYGIHGVCVITQEEKKIVDRKMVTYLVLEPLGHTGSRYLVPTHNTNAMEKIRPILSREEMECLLASPEIRQDSWIPDEGGRKQHYRELLGSGDRERLLRMLYTVYGHKQRQLSAGRKFHMCDENFLRDAEKILAGEISAVMQLEPDRAKVFIREHLK